MLRCRRLLPNFKVPHSVIILSIVAQPNNFSQWRSNDILTLLPVLPIPWVIARRSQALCKERRGNPLYISRSKLRLLRSSQWRFKVFVTPFAKILNPMSHCEAQHSHEQRAPWQSLFYWCFQLCLVIRKPCSDDEGNLNSVPLSNRLYVQASNIKS